MAFFNGPSSSASARAAIAFAACVTGTLALAACGDDKVSGGAGGTSDTVTTGNGPSGSSQSGNPTTGTTASNGTSGSGTSTASNGSTTGTTATSTTATTASQTSASITVGALMSCGDAGLMDCFSSYECAMADRCEDQGLPDAPVPCCIPGMRGPGLAGDMCTGEADCFSSLCFEIKNGTDVCTDACDDVGDCPAPFVSCNFIAGSGSNEKFCLP